MEFVALYINNASTYESETIYFLQSMNLRCAANTNRLNHQYIKSEKMHQNSAIPRSETLDINIYNYIYILYFYISYTHKPNQNSISTCKSSTSATHQSMQLWLYLFMQVIYVRKLHSSTNIHLFVHISNTIISTNSFAIPAAMHGLSSSIIN